MALIDLIAKGSTSRVGDQFIKGQEAAQMRDLRGLMIEKQQHEANLRQEQEMHRQSIRDAGTDEERSAAEQAAINANFGHIVADNYKAKMTLNTHQLQQQSIQNDQVLRHIGAIRTMEKSGNALGAQQAYSEARKYAINVLKYPANKLPESYQEAKRQGILDREEKLALASQEQYKRLIIKRKLEQKDRQLDIMQQNANSMSRRAANSGKSSRRPVAPAAYTKAAQKVAEKAYKLALIKPDGSSIEIAKGADAAARAWHETASVARRNKATDAEATDAANAAVLNGIVTREEKGTLYGTNQVIRFAPTAGQITQAYIDRYKHREDGKYVYYIHIDQLTGKREKRKILKSRIVK